MEARQKQAPAKPKKKGRKKVPYALKNVVSLRISDQEKRVLERVTATTSKNISDVVREAIEFWLDRHKTLCLEN